MEGAFGPGRDNLRAVLPPTRNLDAVVSIRGAATQHRFIVISGFIGPLPWAGGPFGIETMDSGQRRFYMRAVRYCP